MIGLAYNTAGSHAIPGYSNSHLGSSLGKNSIDPTYADIGSTTGSKKSLTSHEISSERVLLNPVPGVNTDLDKYPTRKPTFTDVFMEKGTVSSSATALRDTVNMNMMGGAFESTRGSYTDGLEQNRALSQLYLGKGTIDRLNKRV